MEKEFVPYEQALDLKELGFDELTLAYCGVDGRYHYKDLLSSIGSSEVKRPTFSQAFRWFRKKYGYDISIKKCTPSEYKFEIEQLFVEGDNYYFIDFVFKTYEESELACLKKLIEIVKSK